MWKEFGKAQLKIVAVSASTLVHQQEKYLEEGFDAFISKPFRAEQIYDCLANLLHVEYQYTDEHRDDMTDLEVSDIPIPNELRQRLIESAELYNVAQVNQCLDELASLGSDASRLAEHLRGFAANYDMNAILNILEEANAG